MRFFLRVFRRLLLLTERRLNYPSIPTFSLPTNGLQPEQLRRLMLNLGTDARDYLELHLDRLVRTLQVVPRSNRSGAEVLELGSYGHLTYVLESELGYAVRGAYLGPLGRIDRRIIRVGGEAMGEAFVDLFDAERDIWPYEVSSI